MQYIYAYETTASAPASQFQNFLEKSILSVKDQYLYLLLCIREIANFVETDAKIKAGKHLKNDKDKNFSTKLLSNVLVQYLNNDKEFNIELKNASIASLLDDDNIRQLYKKLTESEAYVDYLTNGTEFNVEADKSIITFLLNNLILEDENFTTNMEELFTNWMDDAEFVVEAVHEVIQKSKNELKLHLEKGNLKDKFKEGGVDTFRADVRKNMERELRNGIRSKVKASVFNALVAANGIDIPKALLSQEIVRQREQAMKQFGANASQIKPEMLPDELFVDNSRRSVALALLVSEIIAKNSIKTDAERVRALVDEVAQSYESPAEVVQWYYSSKEQMSQIESAVLEDQVVDLILAQAQISDKAVGYEELLRPQQ